MEKDFEKADSQRTLYKKCKVQLPDYFIHPKHFKNDVRELLGPRYEAMINKGELKYDRVRDTYINSMDKQYYKNLTILKKDLAKKKMIKEK
mmetsp:Transcript_5193/g.4379  ORF Transcript_5193/g.4379 Transcript_5193/m.4379 type:complete len:91 (+) Transcript_5193:22-294(+)